MFIPQNQLKDSLTLFLLADSRAVFLSVLVCFQQMWKSVVGHDVSMKVAAETDDWETDPDFEASFHSVKSLNI